MRYINVKKYPCKQTLACKELAMQVRNIEPVLHIDGLNKTAWFLRQVKATSAAQDSLFRSLIVAGADVDDAPSHSAIQHASRRFGMRRRHIKGMAAAWRMAVVPQLFMHGRRRPLEAARFAEAVRLDGI